MLRPLPIAVILIRQPPRCRIKTCHKEQVLPNHVSYADGIRRAGPCFHGGAEPFFFAEKNPNSQKILFYARYC